MKDIFQPQSEPAKSIYEAFQLEASMRDGRSLDEWQAAERTAVHREAAIQARKLGLHVLTMEQVEQAERHAFGSIDYGSKWASAVVSAMRPL
ncbi:hypothetical protein [Pseudomonas sp. RIT-PI-o]|uniref:hypothetical protein n=1 Tax=Pseudomonas sp. RIT-PI-o TaxID=1690246 RepID=UPI0006CD8235|nr:hypothetical protein [Pseudomonas sp. RIT-PI-o]KPG82227.1 hypothetical protein AEQ63_13575 [Pseudomonas sp. RIT-PI-o]